MTEKRLDEMMRVYCDPGAEAFAVREKKNRGVKTISVIAAALVLVILGALIVPMLTDNRHSFVLTVGAASNRLNDSSVGTVYSEHHVYDKDMNPVDHYSVMEAELMLNGEDIEDVSFRSMNGCGRFFVDYNPDFDDYHDDAGWWYDSEGKKDPFYVGWRTYDYDDYYNKSEINTTNDWSKEYLYHIWYTAVDDNDMFLQPDNANEGRNDIVEITVTFTDGDTMTKRLSVTYPDGVLTVKEIG